MIESQICTVRLHNQNAERHQGRRAVSRELPHRPTPPKLWCCACVADVRLEPENDTPQPLTRRENRGRRLRGRSSPRTRLRGRSSPRTENDTPQTTLSLDHSPGDKTVPTEAGASRRTEKQVHAHFSSRRRIVIAARQRRHIPRDAAGVAGRVSRPKTPPAPAPARHGSQHLRRGSRGEKALGLDDGPARCVRAGSGHQRLLPPRRGEAIKGSVSSRCSRHHRFRRSPA